MGITTESIASTPLRRWPGFDKLVLGLIFCLAGIAKLTACGSFEDCISLESGPLGAPPLLWSVAGAIELVVAAMLWIPKYGRFGAMCSLCLSGVFAVSLALLKAMGHDPSSCGCFGHLSMPDGTHVMIVLGMTVLSLLSLDLRQPPSSVHG